MLEILKALPSSSSTKPPLLFLHGAFSGAWVWAEHFLPYFADHGYPAYALSLRGHGGSHGREQLAQLGLDDYVEDAREAIRSLGRPPILLGHSMGGMVAQRCLGLERLSGLVLMSAVPPRGALASNFHLGLRAPVLWFEFTEAAAAGPRRSVMASPRMRQMLLSDDLPPSLVASYMGRMQRESRRALADLQFPNIWLGAWCYGVPALVTGRADDGLIPRAVLTETAWFHASDLRVLSGDAHLVMLESRWQESADLIRDWLERRFR